jgi:predicted RND superfamily exporter protein
MHKGYSKYNTSINRKRKRNDIKIEEEISSQTNNSFINNETSLFSINYLNKNPIFIYHSTIINANEGNLFNNKFETFYSSKDKKLYLVSPNHFNYQLHNNYEKKLFLILNTEKIIFIVVYYYLMSQYHILN